MRSNRIQCARGANAFSALSVSCKHRNRYKGRHVEERVDAAAVGKKLADPLSDIWALFTEFNHTWSDGDATNGHEEGTHIIFQPIMPFKLMANYKDFKDSPNISGVNLPDFDPLVDITSPADGLDLGIKMPQQVHAAIHHQWNDKLALLGSVGWEEFSEFGKVQVGVTNTCGISTTLDADFRDVWHFGIGTEYQYKPKWDLSAGFSYDTSMSTDRTRPIVIPLGNMYRYAIGVKHKKREDLTPV